MAKVTLWPFNKIVEIDSEKSLLEHLKANGIEVKSDCGGHASCAKCVVKIPTGETNLSPPEFKELKLLGNVFHLTKERLSCQTRILGDVTVDLSSQQNSEKITENIKPSFLEKSRPKSHLKKGAAQSVRQTAAHFSEKNQERTYGPSKHRDNNEEEPQDDSWFRHWEKEKASDNANANTGPKRLAGNRRPRKFKTQSPTDDKIKKE